MIVYKRLALICFSAALVAGVAACDKQGPAESAGESIDQAVEKTGDKMEEVVKKTGDKMEEASENLKK